MRRLIFIISLCALFEGCIRPSGYEYVKEDQIPHRVSLGDRLGVEDREFEHLFFDLVMTELVLPDSFLVSHVDKMIQHQEKLIFLDKRLSLPLVFDSNGHFKGKIGELGLGPGQYQGIKDVSVWGDTLTILSSADLKLFHYSLSNLGFLSSSKIDFFGNGMTHLSENEFLFYINHNPSDFISDRNVIYLNTTTSITKTFFPYDHTKSNAIIPFSGFISNQRGDIYFSLPFDDKVYIFRKEKLDFDLIFETDIINDFTRSNREDFQKFLFKGLFHDPANNVSVLGSTFLKNDNYLVFSYYLKGRLYYGLYSLLSNQLRTFSKGFKNDFSFQLVGEPMVITENNELIFVANGETIQNYRQQEGFGDSFFGNMLKDREFENSLFLFKVKIKPF